MERFLVDLLTTNNAIYCDLLTLKFDLFLENLDHCHHIIVNISLFFKSFFVHENVMYFGIAHLENPVDYCKFRHIHTLFRYIQPDCDIFRTLCNSCIFRILEAYSESCLFRHIQAYSITVVILTRVLATVKNSAVNMVFPIFPIFWAARGVKEQKIA